MKTFNAGHEAAERSGLRAYMINSGISPADRAHLYRDIGEVLGGNNSVRGKLDGMIEKANAEFPDLKKYMDQTLIPQTDSV